MAVTAEFNRALVSDIDGAFLSYGAGADIDAAFDDACLTDRFDLGSSGAAPSLVDVDPAADRTEMPAPQHPHLALRLALETLPGSTPGAVTAVAVAPLREFKHRTAAVQVTDPSLTLPGQPGPLWLYPQLLAAATELADLTEGETVVSGDVPRLGSARYKASAEAIRGPKQTRYAVVPQGQWTPISVHDTASEARKAALVLAREKTAGPLVLDVRPVVTRENGDPFIRVTRARVAAKVPVKLVVASLKNPEKAGAVTGWLFFGRIG